MATLNYNDFQTAGDSNTFVYNGKVYNCLLESRDETNETAVILVEQGKTDWQYVVEFDRDTNTIKYIDEA
jgi:hypothetical protein